MGVGQIGCATCKPKVSGLGRLFRGLAGDPYLDSLGFTEAEQAAGAVSYGPSLEEAFGAGAYTEGGHIFDAGGARITPDVPTDWGSIVGNITKTAGQVLPSIFGPSKTPTAPKPGVTGFLTSAPVLIGGAVLLGLLLLRRKRS